MQIALLLRVQVVRYLVKHRLNVENGTGTGVGAHADEDRGNFAEGGFDDLEGFEGRV